MWRGVLISLCGFFPRPFVMPTIYQQLLGERFARLDPILQTFFSLERGGRAAGEIEVIRGKGAIRSLVAFALGIPPAGRYALELDVTEAAGRQSWRRTFGRHVLATRQRGRGELLVESTGAASLGFELRVENGAITFHPRRAWILGVPIPLWLAPDIDAENTADPAGGWLVRVNFRVPLLGLIGVYQGVVHPIHAPVDAPADAVDTSCCVPAVSPPL